MYFLYRFSSLYCFFFFQAEDGIRDVAVTGVQTCALPICAGGAPDAAPRHRPHRLEAADDVREREAEGVPGRGRGERVRHVVRPREGQADSEIGRASCRERV